MQVGDYSIVMNGEHHPLCVTEKTEVRILPFKDVDEASAYEYGEGERTLAWWKPHLWDYFVQECVQLDRQATVEMPIICERFRVIS